MISYVTFCCASLFTLLFITTLKKKSRLSALYISRPYCWLLLGLPSLCRPGPTESVQKTSRTNVAMPPSKLSTYSIKLRYLAFAILTNQLIKTLDFEPKHWYQINYSIDQRNNTHCTCKLDMLDFLYVMIAHNLNPS